MSDENANAFKAIGEVASELGVPQHVLRFWETRFPQVHPLKRGGGRRYYRPEDVALLHGIRFLLYAKGFTIKGVQRLLREQGVRFVAATASGELVPDQGPVDPAGLQHGEPSFAPDRNAPGDLELAASPVAEQAMPEIDRTEESAGRRSGLGSFLKRKPDGADRIPGDLSKEQVGRLQDVIFDLLECKRILDQVR